MGSGVRTIEAFPELDHLRYRTTVTETQDADRRARYAAGRGHFLDLPHPPSHIHTRHALVNRARHGVPNLGHPHSPSPRETAPTLLFQYFVCETGDLHAMRAPVMF